MASDFEQCKECKEWDWKSSHKCAPEYFFIHEIWGDEPQKVNAHSFHDAAVKFAEIYNEDDFPLMDGDIEEVTITHSGESKKFNVSAEPDIVYSASEITGGSDE